MKRRKPKTVQINKLYHTTLDFTVWILAKYAKLLKYPGSSYLHVETVMRMHQVLPILSEICSRGDDFMHKWDKGQKYACVRLF